MVHVLHDMMDGEQTKKSSSKKGRQVRTVKQNHYEAQIGEIKQEHIFSVTAGAIFKLILINNNYYYGKT